MDVLHYLVIASVLAAGAALHSAAGFGYALLSVNLLLLAGVDPYQAIPMVTVSTLVQSVAGLWHLRHEVPWRSVVPALALVTLSMPVGVWTLGRLTALDATQIRQVFGGVLLVVLAVHWFWRPRPRPRVHPLWTAAALLGGGFLGGLCGMAGPPIVLWVMAHEWSSERTRVTLWTLFLAMTPIGLLFFYGRFGPPVLEAAGLAVLFVPAVLLGTWPGIWLGNRIPKPALRRLAMALLVIIALFMLLQPLLAGQRS